MCLRILFSQVTEEMEKLTQIFLEFIEQMANFLTVEKYILKKSVSLSSNCTFKWGG